MLFIDSRDGASGDVEMSLAHVREVGVSDAKLGISLAGVPIIAQTLSEDEGTMTRLV